MKKLTKRNVFMPINYSRTEEGGISSSSEPGGQVFRDSSFSVAEDFDGKTVVLETEQNQSIEVDFSAVSSGFEMKIVHSGKGLIEFEPKSEIQSFGEKFDNPGMMKNGIASVEKTGRKQILIDGRAQSVPQNFQEVSFESSPDPRRITYVRHTDEYWAFDRSNSGSSGSVFDIIDPDTLQKKETINSNGVSGKPIIAEVPNQEKLYVFDTGGEAAFTINTNDNSTGSISNNSGATDPAKNVKAVRYVPENGAIYIYNQLGFSKLDVSSDSVEKEITSVTSNFDSPFSVDENIFVQVENELWAAVKADPDSQIADKAENVVEVIDLSTDSSVRRVNLTQDFNEATGLAYVSGSVFVQAGYAPDAVYRINPETYEVEEKIFETSSDNLFGFPVFALNDKVLFTRASTSESQVRYLFTTNEDEFTRKDIIKTPTKYSMVYVETDEKRSRFIVHGVGGVSNSEADFNFGIIES